MTSHHAPHALKIITLATPSCDAYSDIDAVGTFHTVKRNNDDVIHHLNFIIIPIDSHALPSHHSHNKIIRLPRITNQKKNIAQ